MRITAKSARWGAALVLAVSGLTATSLAVAGPASASSPRLVVVDDTATSGQAAFAYSGSWKTCKHCVSGAHRKAFSFSTQVGASVTVTFVGTQATFYGVKDRLGGRASVTVDGRDAGRIDYRSSDRRVAGVFSTQKLSFGVHTVKITVKEPSRHRTHNKIVSIDRVDVTVPRERRRHRTPHAPSTSPRPEVTRLASPSSPSPSSPSPSSPTQTSPTPPTQTSPSPSKPSSTSPSPTGSVGGSGGFGRS